MARGGPIMSLTEKFTHKEKEIMNNFDAVKDNVVNSKPTTFSSVKDSGTRQEFSTGAVRDAQEGKGRFDLLPYHAITRLAQHFENGSRKYGDDNWRQGIPLRRYLDSMMRHSFKFLAGMDDEDHLAAVIWNACCLLETQEMIRSGQLPKELDNLPKPIMKP